jgi:TRAP-type C4-dicarboxylate transport system permease small subunit
VRRAFDAMYRAAGALAAVFLVITLAMSVAGIAGRLLNFQVRGADAYAGYAMAASSFLALAYTLRRGEHIRVTMVLAKVPARISRKIDLLAHLVGTALSIGVAAFSVDLVWTSYSLNDVATGIDATPMWIPQLSMAIGTAVFAAAMLDSLMATLRRRIVPAWRAADELAFRE